MAMKSLGVAMPESEAGSGLDLNGFFQLVSRKLQVCEPIMHDSPNQTLQHYQSLILLYARQCIGAKSAHFYLQLGNKSNCFLRFWILKRTLSVPCYALIKMVQAMLQQNTSSISSLPLGM